MVDVYVIVRDAPSAGTRPELFKLASKLAEQLVDEPEVSQRVRRISVYRGTNRYGAAGVRRAVGVWAWMSEPGLSACIHRGSREIGGSCVELAANGERLVLDLGLPLEAEPEEVALPQIEGLTAAGAPPLALMLSHGHPDHYGLAGRADPSVPVYIGEAASGSFRRPRSSLGWTNRSRIRGLPSGPGDDPARSLPPSLHSWMTIVPTTRMRC